MAGLGQFLLQRRQGRPRLGELRLLGEDVGAGGAAELELLLDQVQLLLLRRQDLLGRPDLVAQRRLLHRRRHDVCGEGELDAFQLETLVIDLRLQRLQFTPRPPNRSRV